MKEGRPLKYKKAEEIKPKIKEYFEECEENDKPKTIIGLALALDLTRDQLIKYQEGKYKKLSEEEEQKFHNTIKKAKEECERYAAEQLFGNGTKSGVIFNLKNNYGWKDKKELEHSGGISLTQLSKKADELEEDEG
mgnify:CR=1 FL=1